MGRLISFLKSKLQTKIQVSKLAQIGRQTKT